MKGGVGVGDTQSDVSADEALLFILSMPTYLSCSVGPYLHKTISIIHQYSIFEVFTIIWGGLRV